MNKVLERKFSREEVERAYSHVASVYDLWAKLTESRAVTRALELADIRDGESILEVAVGTGLAFKAIVEHNRHGSNEGVDLSPAMLSAAVKRMQGTGFGNYHLEVASAYTLPYGDGKFDLLINNYMLDLLPEPDFPKILEEFRRVLRPSGRIAIVTMAFGDKWYNRPWRWVAKYIPSLLTECRPVLVEKSLREAGFKRIRAETLSQNTVPSQIIAAVIQ